MNLVDVADGKYTLQEIFDYALIKMREQGRPATDKGHRELCLYRAPDGAKCVIGHMIPDELYRPIMEKKPIQLVLSIMRQSYAFKGADAAIRFELLMQLREAHDNASETSCFAGNFELAMSNIAHNFGLKWTPQEHATT